MPSLYVYPQNLESTGGEYPHFVTFTAIARGGVRKDTVALYLPADALKSAYTQTYGDADLGAVGVAIANRGGERAVDTMMGAIQGAKGAGVIDMVSGILGGAGSAAGQLNLGPAIRQAAVNKLMQAAEAKFGGAITALKKKAGMIVNPHKAVIYTGPGGFRTFSFSYTMTPENAKEAEAIAKIVHFFKWHMHPGTPTFENKVTSVLTKEQFMSGMKSKTITHTQGGTINTSLSLTYPEEFHIKMHVNRKSKEDASNPLFRIKNCFLESLNVDYTTSGAPAFITKDAKSVPATTTMAMSFKETELMTKNSVAEGF